MNQLRRPARSPFFAMGCAGAMDNSGEQFHVAMQLLGERTQDVSTLGLYMGQGRLPIKPSATTANWWEPKAKF